MHLNLKEIRYELYKFIKGTMNFSLYCEDFFIQGFFIDGRINMGKAWILQGLMKLFFIVRISLFPVSL